MQVAIDKNKLKTIKMLVSEATIDDLFYAYKKNNINAVVLIFQNPKIRQAIHKKCVNLTLDEKRFLLDGTDPKDIANIIKSLKK